MEDDSPAPCSMADRFLTAQSLQGDLGGLGTGICKLGTLPQTYSSCCVDSIVLFCFYFLCFILFYFVSETGPYITQTGLELSM